MPMWLDLDGPILRCNLPEAKNKGESRTKSPINKALHSYYSHLQTDTENVLLQAYYHS